MGRAWSFKDGPPRCGCGRGRGGGGGGPMWNGGPPRLELWRRNSAVNDILVQNSIFLNVGSLLYATTVSFSLAMMDKNTKMPKGLLFGNKERMRFGSVWFIVSS